MRAAVIPVTAFQQNATLIWCTATRRAAVIDPGGDLDRIAAAIAQHGVTLEKILLTHGHIDHCGLAGVFAAERGVPIEGPQEEDRFWIARLEDDSRGFGLEGRVFEPDRWLEDGDQVTVGALTLDVYHTPGHTPGHVIFHHPESRFAQVGDVLFQGSIGRTDFPRSDHDALIASITGKLWPLGDDTVFVPGHGQASRFGIERRSNPFVADHVLAAAAG
ncbi:MBL fold metallo-hydrolase [Sphingomonas morindae]|uniref:MBL fold metallo-hydrolase n=1 Tax=Sphingomonas morindae TaxID=1541170 RepID=A0ABY4XC84_9SPHN|nr:MBL fold metallo-hydrolase [Sphingomonas morindae]